MKIKNILLLCSISTVICLSGCGTKEAKTTYSSTWEKTPEEKEIESNLREQRELEIKRAEMDAKIEASTEEVKIEVKDGIGTLMVPSTIRDIFIPTYIAFPDNFDETQIYPLVLMTSCYAGDHNCYGGYDDVVDALTEKGLIVVMFDYPSYGKSTESLLDFSLTNIKADALDVLIYMQTHYRIGKIGGFGYSLGGRVILEMLAEEIFSFDAINLVAPAAETESFVKSLYGGRFGDLCTVASKEGSADGFSNEWYEDLSKYNDDLATRAKEKFNGPAMVTYAFDDICIPAEVGMRVSKTFGAAEIALDKGGHSYGLTDDIDEKTATLVRENIALFFWDRLK